MQKAPLGRFTPQQMKGETVERRLTSDLEEKGRFMWFKKKYPSGKERDLWVTKEGIENRATIDMTVIDKSPPSKVLIIHGTGDEVIPFQVSDLLWMTTGCKRCKRDFGQK